MVRLNGTHYKMDVIRDVPYLPTKDDEFNVFTVQHKQIEKINIEIASCIAILGCSVQAFS